MVPGLRSKTLSLLREYRVIWIPCISVGDSACSVSNRVITAPVPDTVENACAFLHELSHAILIKKMPEHEIQELDRACCLYYTGVIFENHWKIIMKNEQQAWEVAKDFAKELDIYGSVFKSMRRYYLRIYERAKYRMLPALPSDAS